MCFWFCHGPPSIARRARRQSGARAACERESGTEVDPPGDRSGDRCRPAGRRLSKRWLNSSEHYPPDRDAHGNARLGVGVIAYEPGPPSLRTAVSVERTRTRRT